MVCCSHMEQKDKQNQEWASPRFYTVREAAVILKHSEKSIRRFLDRGILHSSKATRNNAVKNTMSADNNNRSQLTFDFYDEIMASRTRTNRPAVKRGRREPITRNSTFKSLSGTSKRASGLDKRSNLCYSAMVTAIKGRAKHSAT